MTKIVKGILIFALGAGIGGYAGFLLGVRKCDQIVEEEAEQWRKAIRDKNDKIKEKMGELTKDAEGIEELSAGVEVPVKDKYNKLVRTYVSDMGKNLEEVEDIDNYSKLSRRDARREGVSDSPYVITNTQFYEEMEHYDKTSLSYYEDDDTLADENEEIIADVDTIVGEDSLNQFGNGSEDPEVVYVRNDRMNVDYEIIRLSKSYKETVLGYTDENGGGR